MGVTAGGKTTSEPVCSADGVAWDLNDLYSGVDDPRITRDLEAARKRAQLFEATYRDKINAAGGPKAELLLAAVTELESLSEQMDRSAAYAGLVHAAKTDDPRHGALLSKTRELRTAINQHLIFFDLEWVKLPDDIVKPLLDHPRLARYRHYLEQKRAWRPHYLSEPEEKILDEKAVTGRAAFVRLFDETMATLKFPFARAGKTDVLAFQQINAKLYDPDRSIRRAAARRYHARLARRCPPADLHLQQPRPRSQDGLHVAPLPRSDGAATPGQRNQQHGGRGTHDRGGTASRHGAALLPAQGPIAAHRAAP